jgi:hypothetical protein
MTSNPNIIDVSLPSDDDETKSKKRKRSSNKNQSKRKRFRTKKPWHASLKHGSSFSDYMSKESSSYATWLTQLHAAGVYEDEQEETSSDEDSDNENNTLRTRFGPQVFDEYVATGDTMVQNVHLLSKKDITKEDEERWGIDAQSDMFNAVSTGLRREILIFLAKSKQPMQQFIECLAQACDTTTSTFIWVFPDDTHSLSYKDPKIAKRQQYTLDDFLMELLQMYAKSSIDNKDGFIDVLLFIQEFLKGVKQKWVKKRKNEDDDEDDKKKILPFNLPQTPFKPKSSPTSKTNQDILHVGTTSTTTATTTITTTTTSTIPSIIKTKTKQSRADKENEIMEKIKLININEWIKGFEKLTNPDGRLALFNPDMDRPDQIPLGLLILKPEARGLIRNSYSTLITEIQKNFKLDDLLYTEHISSNFAKFVAAERRRAMNGKIQFVSNARESITNTGVINVFNSKDTRYTIERDQKNRDTAIHYFKNVDYRDGKLQYIVKRTNTATQNQYDLNASFTESETELDLTFFT